MKFKGQIQKVVKKLNYLKWMMCRMRDVLPLKYKTLLYMSLVEPILRYNILVWGFMYANSMYRIMITQKCFIRLIWSCGIREHTAPLFVKLNILPFLKILMFEVVKCVFRLINGLLSLNNVILQTAHSDYSLRSNDRTLFVIPRFRTNVGCFSLRNIGPRLWNKLPPELGSVTSIFVFKRSLFLYLQGCSVHNIKELLVW